MSYADKIYNKLVKKTLLTGEGRDDRTGTGTISTFGNHVTYDLRKGFPILTTKRVAWKTAISEMLWFLHGCPDPGSSDRFKLAGKLWEPWAEDTHWGPAWGPIYGEQWRDWNYKYDQFVTLLDGLESDPHGRRHLISAWNVSELGEMALPPCHFAMQFYVSNKGYLDCQLYQRSADLALGVPFNVVGYAFLTHAIANELGYVPRYLHHSLGDTHVYLNHVADIKRQITLDRSKAPLLYLPTSKPVLELDLEDIQLVNYKHQPAIKYQVSV